MSERLSEEEMLRRFKAEERSVEIPPELSARIWAEISPKLQVYDKPKHAWWPLLRFKPVIAIAASLVFSFVAGRLWERSHQPQANRVAQSTADRILLTAAADHLDRSERFLVELRMSREPSPELVRTARDLLNDNRLYQQTAVFANDAGMADVLDRLGRLLTEIAHSEPGSNTVPGLTQDDFQLNDLMRAIRTEQRRTPMRA